MPTLPVYAAWFGILVLEILALYIGIECRQIRRFWDLYSYFGLSCVVSSLRFVTLQHSGLDSTEYFYFYYYTDAILTLSLAIVAARLFAYAYGLKTWNGISLRLVVPGLTAVALFSFAAVQDATSKLLTHFTLELSRNLYYAILVLTVAGWIATLVKRMRASAEVKLLWVFVIYLAILAAGYGVSVLAPTAPLHRAIMGQTAGLWFAAGCTFAVLSDEPLFT